MRIAIYSNEDLLIRLRKGESTAFEHLYHQHFNRVAYWITQNNGNRSDAEDLFQELLLVLYKNVIKPEFRLSSSIDAYVNGIARKMWLYKLRTQKKTFFTENITEVSDNERIKNGGIESASDNFDIFEKNNSPSDHIEKVLQYIDELKDDCRRLLSDFYFQKIQLKEIGVAMGYSDDFVRRKKLRCMEYLRKKVFENLSNTDDC
jgi:RNA polymerase sigma factor (sigma-70 family)